MYLNSDVYTETRNRVSWAFDKFQKIYVSFSGGKDSTVLTHIVLDEAIKRNRKVGLLFIDWECQFDLTIEHIKDIFELYKDNIEPYWITLPIKTWNGCSQYEPEWVCWEEGKEDIWVRQKPDISIKDGSTLPFYYKDISFEEFTPKFSEWYANGELCCNFVGIRTQESLNRFRAVAKGKEFTFENKMYTTATSDKCWSVYPIYDWKTEDIWTYYSKFEKPYNTLYDRMYKAGLTIHQMRIDEPFGDTQRKGLWLYQVIEPETWKKMVLRVSGANTGALYSKEMGNILGNYKVTLPAGYTWKSFANMLLDTMPEKTSNHYKNKITVYLHWYSSRGYPDGIPDEADYKLESIGKAPSWRKVVKTLLKNDYWCKGLGFSPTKTSAYNNYLKMMEKRKEKWGIEL